MKKLTKKHIIVIAVVIIAAICAAVIIGTSSSDKPEPAEGQPVTVNLEPETTKKPFFSPDFDKTVKVTLPIDFVDDKYINDLEAFAEINNFYSVSKKGDSHVKIEMRAYSYDLILTSIGMNTVEGIGSAIQSEDYPFFISLPKYNDDFSYVVVSVDKEEYEKATNKDTFFGHIGLFCLYYQSYDNSSKNECEIVVCEEGTNILIETRTLTQKDLE